MKVLLVSSEDPASLNIRDRLLEETDWEDVGRFENSEVFVHEELLIYQKKGTHLFFENVDREITLHMREELQGIVAGDVIEGPEVIAFLSRHRSEMDVRSLTVHPPGNFLQADFGGEAGRVPLSAPFHMTAALKALYREKKALDLKDQTTYEVTHHGPYLSRPSFFIEIGSDPGRWGIPDLGRSIARALLSVDFNNPDRDLPIAIGIGGGHYAPRFTDRAMRNKYAFGHMIPDYILLRESDVRDLVEMALSSTPGAQHAFIHRSKANEKKLAGIDEILDDMGLKAVH